MTNIVMAYRCSDADGRQTDDGRAKTDFCRGFFGVFWEVQYSGIDNAVLVGTVARVLRTVRSICLTCVGLYSYGLYSYGQCSYGLQMFRRRRATNRRQEAENTSPAHYTRVCTRVCAQVHTAYLAPVERLASELLRASEAQAHTDRIDHFSV